MAQTENGNQSVASIEEIQQEWRNYTGRLEQLEGERRVLEQENKTLRSLLEKTIEHRQKSHGELVNLLAGLVSKLPINDVGVVVARLVEHNAHVSEVCAALAHGKVEANMLQPAILKVMERTKRDLTAAIKPLVEELIRLDTPLETKMLQSLAENPDSFFSPEVVRANRCFVKGQLPRERIVRDFGEPAVACFNDLTTDAKFNPRPKPEEIVMSFRNDFEAVLQQDASVSADKRQELSALYQKVQRSKAGAEAQAQKNAFLKLSFILELLHYYNNQSTETPEGTFAQRLPAVVEQLILTGDQEKFDGNLIKEAEKLLAFVAGAEQRQMIINNVGKGGGAGRTLRYVLLLRAPKVTEFDQVVATFIKRLIPDKTAPDSKIVAAVVQLIHPDHYLPVVKAIINSNRLRKNDAEALGLAVGLELGLKEKIEAELKKPDTALSPEQEQQMVWENIKARIAQRNSPNEIATTIRDRLHARYDADEIRQSWLALITAEPLALIRIFSLLPYLPDGKTDPIAQAILESYVSRLVHEKYVDTYNKVVHALRNLFKVKSDSPALLNFINLVKWVNPDAAAKLSQDVGL